MAAQPQEYEWIDFSPYNASLVLCNVPHGGPRLFLLPNETGKAAPTSSFFEHARSLGFEQTESGYLVNKTVEPINLPAYQKVFPKLRTVHLPEDQIRQPASELRPGFNAHLLNERAIGRNLNNHVVYQGDEGRFFYPDGTRASTPVYEDGELAAHHFMRAEIPEDIELSLEQDLRHGLLNQAERQYYREDRLDELARLVSPRPPAPQYTREHLRTVCNKVAREVLLAEMDAEAQSLNASTLYTLSQDIQERFPSGYINPPLPLLIAGVNTLHGKDDPDSVKVGLSTQDGAQALLGRLYGVGRPAQADDAVTGIEQADGALDKAVMLADDNSDPAEAVKRLKAMAQDGQMTVILPAERFEAYQDAFSDHRIVQGIQCHKSFCDYAILHVRNAPKNVNWAVEKADSWDDLAVSLLGGAATAKHLNPYQVPYVSRAKGDISDAMIPRRLFGPMMKALDRVEAQHGDVNEFVARELQWTQEELQERLGADQIDAVALNIASDKNGRGFILADQTGRGKGRILAAMSRYARLNGRKTVFLTEKDNLFSDFYRDLVDIGEADHINPVTLNAESDIKADGEVRYRRAGQKAINNMLAQGSLPDNVNMLMATYSQVNRKAVDSNKPDFLAKACKDAYVLVDESHNCTGKSNTAENISRCISDAHNVTYSSATWAETGNMSIYSRAFPKGVAHSGLSELLKNAGPGLNEVLVTMLTESGAMCRREHDLSRITFVSQQIRAEEHMEVIDQFAKVLTAISSLSDMRKAYVDQYVDNASFKKLGKALDKMAKQAEERQKKGETDGDNDKKGKSAPVMRSMMSSEVGSRTQGLVDHFLLTLKVPVLVESTINDLKSGRKPILMLNNTMEAVMREVLADSDGYWDKDEAPTFRDILRWHLDRCLTWVRQGENGTPETYSLADEDPVLAEVRDEINKLIDDFPPLPISPMDAYRDEVQKAGYGIGELTGRTMRLYNNDDGSVEMVNEKRLDRTDIVHDFNEGIQDVLSMTVATGGVGISVHAGPKFQDQRQRVAILPQLPYSSTKFLQSLGRVNRREQLSVPDIRFVMTDTPGESRILSILSHKLSTMSANLTGNRDSGILQKQHSLLNAYGNLAARQLFEDNATLRDALDVTVKVPNDEKPNWYIKKFLSGLMMFPLVEQQSLLDEVERHFDTIMERIIDRNGVSPLESKQFDWRARVLSKDVIEQGDKNIPSHKRTSFNDPVELVELEYDHHVDVRDHVWVDEQLNESNEQLDEIKDITGMLKEQLQNFKDELRTREEKRAQQDKKRQENLLAKMKKQAAKGGKPATDEIGPVVNTPPTATEKKLKDRIDRLQKFCDYAESYQPGLPVRWDENFMSVLSNDGSLQGIKRVHHKHRVKQNQQGLIVGITVPKEWRQLQHYKLRVLLYDGTEKNIPLLTLLQNDTFKQHDIPWHPNIIKQRWPEGQQITESKYAYLLEGNLFSALDIAKQIDDGTPISYTRDDDSTRQGVLLSKKACADLRNEAKRATVMPVKITAEHELKTLTEASHKDSLNINLYTEAKRGGVIVKLPRGGQNNNIIFSIPGARTAQHQFTWFENELKVANGGAKPNVRKLIDKQGVRQPYRDYSVSPEAGYKLASKLLKEQYKLFVEPSEYCDKNVEAVRKKLSGASEQLAPVAKLAESEEATQEQVPLRHVA